MLIFALIVALLFVSSLAFYAGTLLFKLQAQNKARQANINKRVTNITESIQTIAKGVEQQQCNLSEASIRIYHLLEGLPVLNKPDFAKQYPAMFELYEAVKDLPTHQERNKQPKMETRKQDIKRESLESTLESRILAEMEKLAHFSI
ncbi:DUF2489 domain-containing protein [Paraglaciecola aquimarina]|uniref:DUF2489 domain-containing protein n=1 Tax=Paraglaciecola aquimarina TaxID=1235557 RepID=A0ABU3STN3_9ALTE|nr:DUF2489 domain-containing protein [Paraglaciecola aquimarina]MDU0353363.1 DUF2489 domain-containing protein [Paraglaciecola aquimarina]